MPLLPGPNGTLAMPRLAPPPLGPANYLHPLVWRYHRARVTERVIAWAMDREFSSRTVHAIRLGLMHLSDWAWTGAVVHSPSHWLHQGIKSLADAPAHAPAAGPAPFVAEVAALAYATWRVAQRYGLKWACISSQNCPVAAGPLCQNTALGAARPNGMWGELMRSAGEDTVHLSTWPLMPCTPRSKRRLRLSASPQAKSPYSPVSFPKVALQPLPLSIARVVSCYTPGHAGGLWAELAAQGMLDEDARMKIFCNLCRAFITGTPSMSPSGGMHLPAPQGMGAPVEPAPAPTGIATPSAEAIPAANPSPARALPLVEQQQPSQAALNPTDAPHTPQKAGASDATSAAISPDTRISPQYSGPNSASPASSLTVALPPESAGPQTTVVSTAPEAEKPPSSTFDSKGVPRAPLNTGASMDTSCSISPEAGTSRISPSDSGHISAPSASTLVVGLTQEPPSLVVDLTLEQPSLAVGQATASVPVLPPGQWRAQPAPVPDRSAMRQKQYSKSPRKASARRESEMRNKWAMKTKSPMHELRARWAKKCKSDIRKAEALRPRTQPTAWQHQVQQPTAWQHQVQQPTAWQHQVQQPTAWQHQVLQSDLALAEWKANVKAYFQAEAEKNVKIWTQPRAQQAEAEAEAQAQAQAQAREEALAQLMAWARAKAQAIREHVMTWLQSLPEELDDPYTAQAPAGPPCPADDEAGINSCFAWN